MALDEQSTNVAYVLGRLFAELERIQQDANPDIHATPAYIFPVLEKLTQHYLRKLEKGRQIYHEKNLGVIMNLLQLDNNPLPKNLTLENQGIFILGYYQQKQKFYEKKNINKTVSEEEA